LLNMAVFGAVISYAIVMASYIKLKITRKDLPRPYESPLGIPGAVVGASLALSRSLPASRTRIFVLRSGRPRHSSSARLRTSSVTAAPASWRRRPKSGLHWQRL